MTAAVGEKGGKEDVEEGGLGKDRRASVGSMLIPVSGDPTDLSSGGQLPGLTFTLSPQPSSSQVLDFTLGNDIPSHFQRLDLCTGTGEQWTAWGSTRLRLPPCSQPSHVPAAHSQRRPSERGCGHFYGGWPPRSSMC